MEKIQRQEIALQKWRDNKGLGGFKHPTGFGKMYETITAIKRMQEKNPTTRIIIVVDSDNLRTEWKAKIEALIGIEFLNNNCLIETIHYFQAKRLKHQCNLVVLDEMSRYFSEDRQNIWNGVWVDFKFLLWLDATPDDRAGRDTEFYSMYPCVDVITKDKAEQNGWITKSTTINIGVNFTPEEQEVFDSNEQIIDDNFNKFDRNYEEINKCLTGISSDGINPSIPAYKYCTQYAISRGWLEEYGVHVREGFPKNYSKELQEFERNIHAIWAPDKVLGYAQRTRTAIRNRMNIIYTAENKIQAVIDCLNYYPNKRAIIFSQRTNFASNICKAINNSSDKDIAVEYHSNIESRPLRIDSNGNLTILGGVEYATYVTGKKKGEIKTYGAKTIKDVTIAEVRSGLAKVIVTGSALDRGLDIPAIDLGIVVGFTQNESQDKQRNGRLTRIDLENNNKQAVFINIYVKGTKEEQFLRWLQRNRAEVKWLNHITDIDKQDEYDI